MMRWAWIVALTTTTMMVVCGATQSQAATAQRDTMEVDAGFIDLDQDGIDDRQN